MIDRYPDLRSVKIIPYLTEAKRIRVLLPNVQSKTRPRRFTAKAARDISDIG